MKRSLTKILIPVLAVTFVLVLSAPSSAQTKFLEKVRKVYQLDRTNGKCDLCHEVKPKEEPSRKSLNSFGKMIQDDPAMKPLLGKDDKYAFSTTDLNTLADIVKKLEPLDNDKDGVTNLEELDLGTFPADAKSVPEKLKLAKYRKEKGTAAPAIGPKK